MLSQLFGIFFILLGSFAALCNLIVIIIFVSHKGLRSRSQLYIALAAGDLIFGLGFIFASVHIYFERQAVNQSITVLSCWLQPHHIFTQIGPLLCMTMTLALTLERASSVFLPYWYKTSFKKRHRYIAIALGCMATILHSCITLFMAVNSQNVHLNTCVQIQSSRNSFSMVWTCIIVLNYILCFCLNVISYCRIRSKSLRQNNCEMQRIKLISWISFLSLLSAVVPFLVLFFQVFFLSKLNTMTIHDSYVMLVVSLIPINSASNLFLYLWLKRLFRNQALNVLCFICRVRNYEKMDVMKLRPRENESSIMNSASETYVVLIDSNLNH